jgi:hypothetical protein
MRKIQAELQMQKYDTLSVTGLWCPFMYRRINGYSN